MRLLGKWLTPMQLLGLLAIIVWAVAVVPLATSLANTNSMADVATHAI